MNIAIMGANSLIAQDFIQTVDLNKNSLYLFSRQRLANHISYDKFFDNNYDLVVNFIGAGDPNKIIINRA